MKQFKVLGMGIICAGMMVGCSSTPTEPVSSEVAGAGDEKNMEDTSEEKAFILEHTADLAQRGYEPIVQDKVPERIVLMSTSPFHTLYELGIEEHIVAVPTSTSAQYPEDLDVEMLPSAMGTIDVEKIISLDPDLVILPETSMAVAGETLKQAGIDVYAMSMYDMSEEKNTYEYTKEQTEVLLEAFAQSDEQKEAASRIRSTFSALEERIELFKASQEPKTYLSTMVVSDTDSYTNTSSSVIGVMLGMLGFENMYEQITETDEAAGHGSSPVNLESLVGVETDLFVFLTRASNEEDANATIQSMIDNNPKVWEIVPAVGRGDYIVLTSNYYVSVGIKIVDNMNALLDILE